MSTKAIAATGRGPRYPHHAKPGPALADNQARAAATQRRRTGHRSHQKRRAARTQPPRRRPRRRDQRHPGRRRPQHPPAPRLAEGALAASSRLCRVDPLNAKLCHRHRAQRHLIAKGLFRGRLAQLKGCSCQQVSLETAQSRLDCSALSDLKGKKIILGVIDLSDMKVETPETVAARIRRALPFVAAEDVIVAPDCGMKYLPREVAFGKMKAMVAGAAIVRAEHG